MQTKRAKHIVDILLGVGLLLLMSYQVTGEAGHEWTGIAMTALMIVHQVLNRKWITALFKGKYTPLRVAQMFINAALVICFILTALCGVNMSVHAVPFLGDFMRASLGRRLHLTLSHWCFVLMGLHLGLHIPAMLKGVKGQALRRVGFGLSILAAGTGLWLFLRNNYPNYLLYRVPFAFIDYDKAILLVLLEALLIAFFWVFVGARLPKLLNRRADKNGKLVSMIGILLAVVLGMGLIFAFPAENGGAWNETAAPWSAESIAEETPAPAVSTEAPKKESEEKQVDDDFLWIAGGQYLMGSPENENWRIEDETQHEVTVSGFFMSPYPNWWASIPMPIATFLESYDFSGKTILPFCSHGGGRFGQSLTAIAKLAPSAVIAPGLSVHYSGGSGLPGDVKAWLESQGIHTNSNK